MDQSKSITTGASDTVLSLVIGSLSGASIGALLGTLLFPGIGTIAGLALGGMIGYNAGLISQSYGKLICTPSNNSTKLNAFSGTFATVFTSSTIGGIIGTFIFPGVGTIIGTMLGVGIGTGVALTGLALKNFVLPKLFTSSNNNNKQQPSSAPAKEAEKSSHLNSTRQTLTNLGAYSGVGTVLGWTLGTLVFPGIGTSVGGIIGGFIGATVGFSAESAKLIIDRQSPKQRLIGATGLGLTLGIPTVIGSLVGTFVFPGVGTAVGAGIGAALGTSIVGVGIATLLPRKNISKAFGRIKQAIQKRRSGDNSTEVKKNTGLKVENSIKDIDSTKKIIGTLSSSNEKGNAEKKSNVDNQEENNTEVTEIPTTAKISNNDDEPWRKMTASIGITF